MCETESQIRYKDFFILPSVVMHTDTAQLSTQHSGKQSKVPVQSSLHIETLFLKAKLKTKPKQNSNKTRRNLGLRTRELFIQVFYCDIRSRDLKRVDLSMEMKL